MKDENLTAEEKIDLLLQPDTSPEEVAKVLEDAKNNPGLRKEMALALAIHRSLPVLGDQSGEELCADQVVAEVQARLDSEDVEECGDKVMRELASVKHRRSGILWATLSGCLTILILSAILIPNWKGDSARLLRTEEVAWQTNAPGEWVRSGQELVFSGGFVELEFRSGVTLLIEGPASIRPTGANAGFLSYGRVVADVPLGAEGFVLDSPSGQITDLGTRFGFSVHPNGDAEVHVLEGEVIAEFGEASPANLRESEALRFEVGSQAAASIEGRPDLFLTDLPPQGDLVDEFWHWGFDEVDGDALDTGYHPGGGEGDPARLLAHRKGSTPPSRINGPHGSAIKLDGKNDFLESAFSGISGDAARTVAFWVKVPEDSARSEGYGILAWGRVTRWHPSAWQISVNPEIKNGLLGRIRVGTSTGEVIGTTDIRDGRWHHVAFVLYEASRRPHTDLVLVYLDGELETTSVKGIRRVETDTATTQLWMGRNIASATNDISQVDGAYGGSFFRGALDEVYVIPAALDASAIRSLMESDSPLVLYPSHSSK